MTTARKTKKPATAANSDGHGRKNCQTIPPEQEFRKVLAGHGLRTQDLIIADGSLHRFHVLGDKTGNKNGWYVLHNDGHLAGAGGSWKTGHKFRWHKDPETPLTPQQHRDISAKVEEAQRQREAELKRKHEDAARKAIDIWDKAEPANPDHPYLAQKKVKPCGLRQSDKTLLVPVYNAAGTLQTLQYIDEEGKKRFLPGGRASGGCFPLRKPEPGRPLYIVEGFATGATIMEATGSTVAVAFNAGNLKPVAEAMAKEHPDTLLILACDNDAKTEGNPGLTKGIEAAKAVAAPYVLPTFKNGKGSDFNDLATTEDRDTVLRCLQQEYATTWASLKKPGQAPLPEFPWDTLPPVLRDHARQVATCIQVPPEFPAMAALTVAGFSMGNRTIVRAKQGVAVRPNLYVMVIMASGERKSTAYNPMTAPLEKYQKKYSDQWREITIEKQIYDKEQKRLINGISSTSKKDKKQALRTELHDLQEPAGTCKAFLAENATEEALQTRMVECGERAAVFSDDSRDVLQVLSGIYNEGQNRESIYLKSFDGNAPCRVRRQGREEVFLERPQIGMLLCTHRDKLRKLGANEGLNEGGFVPRIVFIVPDSLIGTRLWTEKELDTAIQDRYTDAVMERLDKYSDQGAEYLFPLDSDAKDNWIQWYNSLEEEMTGALAEYAPLAARWQSLPLRLAATLAEYHGEHRITVDHMRDAIELGRYLIKHAKRAVGIMRQELSRDLKRAVSHICDKRLKRFKAHELGSAMRAKVADVEAWLAALEDAGYVRRTGETEGHKNAAIWESNPQLLK